MYSNFSPECLENNIILSDVSDHYGILTKLWETAKLNDHEPIYYRKSRLTDKEWNHFNRDLKLALSHKLKDFLTTPYDVDVSAEIISQTYRDIIDKYMPLRKISRKQKRFANKPWITRGIKVSIKTKNKLFVLSKRSNDYDSLYRYKKYLNLLTAVKMRARQNHYSELAVRYGNNKSKIWRLINDI